MTREEAIHELGEWLEQMIQHGVPSHSAKRKALATAIALLSAEDIATAYTSGFVEGSVNEALKARPTGEWISIESEPYCKCSACGTYIDALDDYYSFCPFCGADMRGDDDV